MGGGGPFAVLHAVGGGEGDLEVDGLGDRQIRRGGGVVGARLWGREGGEGGGGRRV